MAANDQNVFDKIKTNLAVANREKGNASALTVTSAAKKKADAAAAAKAKADTLKAMAAFVAKAKADAAKTTKAKTATPAPAKDPQGISKTFADLGNLGNDIAYSMAAPMPWVQPTMNFGESVSNFLTSRPQAAPGQGAGDIRTREQRAAANAAFPNTAGTQNAMTLNAGLAREAGAARFTQPFANPVADAPQGNMPATTTGAVTPASIASQMTSRVGSQRAAEMAAAKAAGVAYVPGQAAGTAAKMAQDARAKAEADALNESNMAIESTYNPVLDFLKKQQAQTNSRYEQNAANLKNIFGALTGLSAKDQASVKAQFESSLTKQADDLATRTAEQRAAQAAGAAQAAVTGAERGGGPALVGSPTATATEEAIGQSNAIQTNWAGLMGAQESNALTDIMNRGAGYGQQEVAATNQMAQNLQDALMGIEGQQANIQSQIAQAKVARDQAIANNEADAAAAANKVIGELQLQELKNQGQMDVAALKANASIRLKGMGGTSTPKALKGAAGIAQRAEAVGVPLNEVISQYEAAYTDAFNGLNPNYDPNAPAAKSPKTPTKDQVLKAWSRTIGGSPQTANRIGPLITDWADTQY